MALKSTMLEDSAERRPQLPKLISLLVSQSLVYYHSAFALCILSDIGYNVRSRLDMVESDSGLP